MKKGITTIDQQQYATNILKKFGMHEVKPATTPHIPGKRLTKDMCPEEKSSEAAEMKNYKYREVVGCLMYLLITRHDLKLAVIALSRFVNNPGKDHWTAAMRVLRYISGTLNYGITMGGPSEYLVNLLTRAGVHAKTYRCARRQHFMHCNGK